MDSVVTSTSDEILETNRTHDHRERRNFSKRVISTIRFDALGKLSRAIRKLHHISVSTHWQHIAHMTGLSESDPAILSLRDGHHKDSRRFSLSLPVEKALLTQIPKTRSLGFRASTDDSNIWNLQDPTPLDPLPKNVPLKHYLRELPVLEDNPTPGLNCYRTSTSAASQVRNLVDANALEPLDVPLSQYLNGVVQAR